MLSQLSLGRGGCRPVCIHIATQFFSAVMPKPEVSGNFEVNIKFVVDVKIKTHTHHFNVINKTAILVVRYLHRRVNIQEIMILQSNSRAAVMLWENS